MLRHVVRRLSRGMPRVAVFGRPSQGAAGMAAHPYGDVRRLERLRVHLDAVEFVEPAVELGLVLRPKQLEYLEILVGDRASVLMRGSQRVELLLPPTDAHAAHRSAAAKDIQRCEHLRL